MGPWLGRAVATAILTIPSLAAASNGTHQRTPVIWDAGACLTVVDRSVDPIVNLSYSIPFEDTEVSDDEVDDSRTHQFLAFCRDKDPQTVHPNWVSWDDVIAASLKPLDVDPDLVDDSNVLDLSDEWDACWGRITEDADRRPITEAQAAMPVVWDTTGLAAGPWVVYGYTYEPAFNVYVRRPGLVQIVDDADPASSPPGLAITTEEEILYKGEMITFEGCMSAMEGSTLNAYWAIASTEPEWVPFAEDEPVSGEELALEFLPPEDLSGESAMIRIDITDPMGRSHTAYMNALVTVLMSKDPNACDEGGSFVANPGCEPDTGGGGSEGDGDGSGSGGTGGGSGTATSAGPGTGDAGADGDTAGDDGGGGCSCGVPGNAPMAPLGTGLLALGLLGLRRRR